MVKVLNDLSYIERIERLQRLNQKFKYNLKMEDVSNVVDSGDGLILKPTMDLKWIRTQICITTSEECVCTGKYENILHQKFIDQNAKYHWREIEVG